MNAFESAQRKMIPAVLIYLFQDDKILMLHRNKKENDYHEGKWNGLGGKCEKDESFIEAASRELYEESGLKLTSDRFMFSGLVHFPNFKAHKSEDWICTVYTARVIADEVSKINTQSSEGSLEWVSNDMIMKLPLWEGDKYFLPKVLRSEKFIATIWYEGERVKRYEISDI